ncbi:AgmX/PglI C-terminal domain-containing protein [Candidatus Peregrinibacteria bacterium]|nr:AgmX/PglI C-terminal domain-containing protein [Candidatus Peregrinibacteria bacterium]
MSNLETHQPDTSENNVFKPGDVLEFIRKIGKTRGGKAMGAAILTALSFLPNDAQADEGAQQRLVRELGATETGRQPDGSEIQCSDGADVDEATANARALVEMLLEGENMRFETAKSRHDACVRGRVGPLTASEVKASLLKDVKVKKDGAQPDGSEVQFGEGKTEKEAAENAKALVDMLKDGENLEYTTYTGKLPDGTYVAIVKGKKKLLRTFMGDEHKEAERQTRGTEEGATSTINNPELDKLMERNQKMIVQAQTKQAALKKFAKKKGVRYGELKDQYATDVKKAGAGRWEVTYSKLISNGHVDLGEKKPAEVKGVSFDMPETDALGGMDGATLSRTINRNKSAIEACYSKQLKRNPNLSGKVEVSFTVRADGRVQRVQVTRNTMGNTSVASCICETIKRWVFPKSDSGADVKSLPFVLSPPK